MKSLLILLSLASIAFADDTKKRIDPPPIVSAKEWGSEPQPIPETHGYATSGWNAAPTTAKIIARVAPMLGLEPRLDLPPADQLILAGAKQAAR